ncbi:unnamed protein product [Peronospora belbahrii]|uniref:Uncharacterized protein n=1 Tax=Peronospora belbahrii TaxID=622444 RepID=A0AAU9KQY9_9STRA|nr:unnamed protein product [Peronospora belbahrii]
MMKLFIAAAALAVSFTTALNTRLAAEPSSSDLYAKRYENNKNYCGEVETIPRESFIVFQNRNGADKRVGWCIAVTSSSKNDVSWYAQLNADDSLKPSPVNLTANVALKYNTIVLYVVTSIKTMMKYEYIAGPGVIANVAYNLEMNTEFQTNTGVQYFIRVWINALGGNIPYGDTVPGKGLIVSNVAYDLYIGNHNGIRYITYVATQPVTHFDDDLLVFINELKIQQIY